MDLALRSLVVALLLFCPMVTLADVVTLKSGRQVTGEIVSDGDVQVRIKTKAGILSFAQSQIQNIRKQSDSAPITEALFQSLESGNIDAACTWLETASDIVPLESLMVEIHSSWPGLSKLLPISHKTSARWESLLLKHVPDSSLTIPLIAQVWYREGDMAKVEDILSRHSTTKSLSLPQVHKSLEELLKAAIADDHLGVAARCLEKLPGKSQQLLSGSEAHIINASRLLEQDEWEQAATAYLMGGDAPPRLRRRMLHQLLEQAPEHASSVQTVSRLLQLLEDAVGTLDASSAFRFAEELLPIALDQHLYDPALRVITEYAKLDADKAAPLEHRTVFHKRLHSTPETEARARYDLAMWARDRGLFTEARMLFMELTKHELYDKNARLQLELTDTREASNTLQMLIALHESNRPEELKREVEAFLVTDPPDEYAQHARDLLQLADYARWATRHSLQDQAEVIFQQAQRCISRGDFDQALAHFNRISMDYPESTAAAKAHQMRPSVERQKQRANRRVSSPARVP